MSHLYKQSESSYMVLMHVKKNTWPLSSTLSLSCLQWGEGIAQLIPRSKTLQHKNNCFEMYLCQVAETEASSGEVL